MLSFENVEIIIGCISFAIFLPSFICYPIVVSWKRYPLIRDIKPMWCLCNHLAAFVFTLHVLLDWKHNLQLCIEIAVLKCISASLLFGTFLTKHYILYQRYAATNVEANGTKVPPVVLLSLCGFPFAIIATYRIAMRTVDRCPPVSIAVAACGLLILLVVCFRYFVHVHPCAHFSRAIRLEVLSVLLAVAVNGILQFTTENICIACCILVLALSQNISFLSYVVPPISYKVKRQDEYSVYETHYDDPIIPRLGPGGGGLGKIQGGSEHTLAYGTDTEDHFQQGNKSSPSSNWLTRFFHKMPSAENSSSSKQNQQKIDNTMHSFIATSDLVNSTGSNSKGGGQLVSPELKTVMDLIQEGDSHRLQQFIARTRLTVIHETDHQGKTPLHVAVQLGNVSVIRFLIELGADANKPDRKGISPIHEAVRGNLHSMHDRSNVISELLESSGPRSAMVNCATPAGFTPLHYAVLGDFLGALHTLLRYGANPQFHYDTENRDMHWAAVHVGNRQTLELSRRSPLTLAVELGIEKHVSSMVQSLRHAPMSSSGAGHYFFDTRCPHGLTLLHIALSLGHSKVVDVLLREAKCSTACIHEAGKQNVFHFSAMGNSCEALLAIIDAMDAPDLLPEDVRFAGGGDHVETPSSRSISFFPSHRGILDSAGGVNRSVLTFNAAMLIVQRHAPGYIIEPERLSALEARIDLAVHELRSQNRKEEASTVQQALLIVLRRLRMTTVSSRADLVGSQPPISGTSATAPLFPMATATMGDFSSSGGGGNASPLGKIHELVNLIDVDGMTPLHYAIRNGSPRMCKILTAYGASTHFSCGGSASSSGNFHSAGQFMANMTEGGGPHSLQGGGPSGNKDDNKATSHSRPSSYPRLSMFQYAEEQYGCSGSTMDVGGHETSTSSIHSSSTPVGSANKRQQKQAGMKQPQQRHPDNYHEVLVYQLIAAMQEGTELAKIYATQLVHIFGGNSRTSTPSRTPPPQALGPLGEEVVVPSTTTEGTTPAQH